MNSVRRSCLMGIALGMGMLYASQAVQLAFAGPMELDPRVTRDTGDPISVQRGDGDPTQIGAWSAPREWPVIAIHGALLPTGKVLHYSYPDGTEQSRAMIWDPISDSHELVEGLTDQFCSGLSFLGDGRLLVSGGNSNIGCGRQIATQFDAFSETWSAAGHFATGRWYPTNITLANGSVIIVSGLNEDCVLNSMMEMFEPSEGIVPIPEGERELDLFPRMHLLSSGKIAHVGSEQLTSTFDPITRVWENVDFSNSGYRDQGTSVLVPGTTDEVMIIGGYVNGTPSVSCERIDFNDEETGWQFTGSLNFGRAHANVVILPDGNVLLVGGGTFDFYGGPTLNAELYDPETETWTLVAAQAHGRMYHATAILLPDGRVLSAGQDDGISANRAEFYSPPYLFRGARPEITSAPDSLSFAGPFTIETPQADEIDSVALIRLSAVTHSVNFGQRYVGLDFTVDNSNELTATAPANGRFAPPGYYMLFVVNSAGVPAVARIVQLTCGGDANGDGSVDPLDSGFVLARFGCPVGTGDASCDAADQNGDGAVDPLDSGFVLARLGSCLGGLP